MSSKPPAGLSWNAYRSWYSSSVGKAPIAIVSQAYKGYAEKKSSSRRSAKRSPPKRKPPARPKKTPSPPKEKTPPPKKTPPKKSPPRPTSPKKSAPRPASPSKSAPTQALHEDWSKVAVPSEDERHAYWTVPAGTMLYKGVDASYRDDTVPEAPCFYASLDVAALYAFAQQTRAGEQGKVITVVTTAPLRVIDASKRKTIATLSAMPDRPSELAIVFGTPGEPRRQSVRDPDMLVSRWICEKGFDGFGYPRIAGFHNELMLCGSDKLRRGDLEYRVIGGVACVFELSSSGLRRTLPEVLHEHHGVPSSSPYSPKPGEERRTDRYLPELRRDARQLCEPVRHQTTTREAAAVRAARAGDLKTLDRLLDYVHASYVVHAVVNAGGYSNAVLKTLVLAGANVRWLLRARVVDADLVDFALEHGERPSMLSTAVVATKDPKLLKRLLDESGEEGAVVSLDEALTRGYYPGAKLAADRLKQLGVTLDDVYDRWLSTFTTDKTIGQLTFLLDDGLSPSRPLIGAFNQRQEKVTQLLVDRGARFSSMIEWLSSYNVTELLSFLRLHGAKLNAAELDALAEKLRGWDAEKRQPEVTQALSLVAALRQQPAS
jgi:hypothetical protein